MRTVVMNEGSEWSFAVVDGTSILTEIGPYKSRAEVLKAIEVSEAFIQQFYDKKMSELIDEQKL